MKFRSRVGSACKYVDCVIPLSGEQDLYDALLLLMPDVRFAGEEYANVSHTGKGIEGIEMVYLKRRHSFSSSELRQRVLSIFRTEDSDCPSYPDSQDNSD